jgi:pyruvate ferredoxin oxidoreductase beta subunit
VENYLKRQGRFRHLFDPKRDEETIAHIQATVDHYWRSAAHDNERIHHEGREEHEV